MVPFGKFPPGFSIPIFKPRSKSTLVGDPSCPFPGWRRPQVLMKGEFKGLFLRENCPKWFKLSKQIPRGIRRRFPALDPNGSHSRQVVPTLGSCSSVWPWRRCQQSQSCNSRLNSCPRSLPCSSQTWRGDPVTLSSGWDGIPKLHGVGEMPGEKCQERNSRREIPGEKSQEKCQEKNARREISGEILGEKSLHSSPAKQPNPSGNFLPFLVSVSPGDEICTFRDGNNWHYSPKSWNGFKIHGKIPWLNCPVPRNPAWIGIWDAQRKMEQIQLSQWLEWEHEDSLGAKLRGAGMQQIPNSTKFNQIQPNSTKFGIQPNHSQFMFSPLLSSPFHFSRQGGNSALENMEVVLDLTREKIH